MFGQFPASDRVAKVFPHPVGEARNANEAVLGFEKSVRKTAHRAFGLDVDGMSERGSLNRHDALEERGRDQLTLAGSLAVEERGVDRAEVHHRGMKIGDENRGQRFLPGKARIGLTNSPERLKDGIVGAAPAVRAFVAERCARAIDESVIELLKRRVIQLELFSRAGTKVLDQNIGAANEVVDDFPSGIGAQIDRETSLVRIPPLEGPPLAHEKRADHARGIALQRLDLDHVGAHGAHQRGGVRPGDERADLDDLDAFERPRSLSRPRRFGSFRRARSRARSVLSRHSPHASLMWTTPPSRHRLGFCLVWKVIIS